MKCPTMEQVENATHHQLAAWHRFVEIDHSINSKQLTEQREAMDRNYQRLFKEFGGFTPEISKDIGWDPR